jgi:hypothetical protein
MDHAEAMASEDQERWYSARCVIGYGVDPVTYEERITLWRAASFEDAIARAGQEVATYASVVGGVPLDLVQAYALDADDGTLADGIEVFSLLRDSDLGAASYLDRFFDTGDERQGSTGAVPSPRGRGCSTSAGRRRRSPTCVRSGSMSVPA